MFGERPGWLCQDSGREEEKEREDREGALLAPLARTSVEGSTRQGCSCQDIRQTEREREGEGGTVSCTLRMSECHRLLHSYFSALCLFGPLSVLEAGSLGETR